MRLASIMSRNPVSVDMDDRLAKVKELFDQHHFHHLLVVGHGKLLGVISDRDLLKAVSHNIGTAAETLSDIATLNKRVHQIMTRKPLTLQPDNTVQEAIALFNSQKISCIPIVDDEGKPVGILSWRDILRVLEEKLKRAKSE